MQFAQAADHRFVERGVVVDLQRRVFEHQLVQGFRDALLVAAALGLDRQAEHRHREFQRPHVDVVFVVRVVQHAIELDLLDLGDGGDVTGHGFGHFLQILALQQEQVADLERLLALADVEIGVLGDAPLMDAKHAELSHERVHHDLEHVRERVLAGIGIGVERLGRLAFALVEQRRIAFGGVGQQLDEHIEQLRHAGTVA